MQKKGALAGLRVIDFGQYVAGPLTSMILGDYGADVIHIDPPGGPRWDGYHANAVLARGKRNIILDLKDPNDLAVAKKLISSADILVENFRPGVMDRLGLGYAACSAENPGLSMRSGRIYPDGKASSAPRQAYTPASATIPGKWSPASTPCPWPHYSRRSLPATVSQRR